MPPKDLTQQNAADLTYLREHRPDNHALKGIGTEMKCPKCPYTFTRPSPTDCCPDCGEFFYPDPIHGAANGARITNSIPDVKGADVPPPTQWAGIAKENADLRHDLARAQQKLAELDVLLPALDEVRCAVFNGGRPPPAFRSRGGFSSSDFRARVPHIDIIAPGAALDNLRAALNRAVANYLKELQ